MHLGSLYAALISWLDARAANGRWRLRIDDLDPPRVVAGAEEHILQGLRAHGLDWDGPVLRQNQPERQAAYVATLEHLHAHGVLYPCACSRKTIAAQAEPGWEGPIYPGTCRAGLPATHPRPRALRLCLHQRYSTLTDRALGPISFDLQRLGGDFIVRRADGLIAYQLATVVDDLELGVTHIVRGIDLLSSAPRQLQIYHHLDQPSPDYLHHPVIPGSDGQKLSKSNRAAPVRLDQAPRTLYRLLGVLGIPDLPQPAPRVPGVTELLEHALLHWHPQHLSLHVPPWPVQP